MYYDLQEIIKQAELIKRRVLEAKQMVEDDSSPEAMMKACELIDMAIGTGERMTCDLREYLPSRYNPDYFVPRIRERALEISGITCDLTEEGYFHMFIPYLPPKKRHGTTSYISMPLNEALKKFRKEHPDYMPDRNVKQLILFYFELHGKDWTQRVDIDNWETNFITDQIASYYLVDDDPAHLGVAMGVGEAKGDMTGAHVYLMPLLESGDFLTKLILDGKSETEKG